MTEAKIKIIFRRKILFGFVIEIKGLSQFQIEAFYSLIGKMKVIIQNYFSENEVDTHTVAIFLIGVFAKMP
ncbi:hypothetical protein EF405_05720 [Cyclobacteriaceae bacterium YHN15]|nr:hypothetical protein EF405_05720 [Cyclobacteriaceae bacterium YHN15]